MSRRVWLVNTIVPQTPFQFSPHGLRHMTRSLMNILSLSRYISQTSAVNDISWNFIRLRQNLGWYHASLAFLFCFPNWNWIQINQLPLSAFVFHSPLSRIFCFVDIFVSIWMYFLFFGGFVESRFHRSMGDVSSFLSSMWEFVKLLKVLD